MNSLGISIAGLLCAFALTVQAEQSTTAGALSAADAALIRDYTQRASNLQQSIGDLQARISKADRKSYLDPKGMQRDRWQRMIGAKSRELATVKRELAELESRGSTPGNS